MITKNCPHLAATGSVLRTIAVTAFVCLMPGSAHATEKTKTVRDWTVHCTQDKCEATTEMRAGGRTVRAIVGRNSNPGAAIHVSITRNPPGPEDGSALVSVNGTDLVPRSLNSPDGRLYSFGPLVLNDPLIEALKDGQSLSIASEESVSSGSDELSLSGVSAAFLFMDEFQDRLGRTDAIVRVGSRSLPTATADATPSQATAGAHDAEAIEFASLPARFRRIAVENADCDPVSDAGPPKTAWRVTLPDGLVLWEASCWYGAYNIGSAFYIAPADDPEAGGLIEFTSPSSHSAENPWNAFSLTNAFWDPKALELTSWHKSRGVGDCGIHQRHRYRDGIFRLYEFSAKECDGVWMDPSDYPVIYKAPD